MFKLSHKSLIAVSGLIWLAIGCYLLSLGVHFLVDPSIDRASLPILGSLAPFVGGLEEAAIFIIMLSLFVGYMKGRYVLSKSANRGIERIKTLPNPTSFAQIYSPKYYLLLAGMICLGVLARFVSTDFRGLVDVTIGAALVNGAMIYFRGAFAAEQKA
jgi:hypothetical protein